MVNSRPTAPTSSSSSSSSAIQLNTAYSLALLSEYTHTLDSLPPDLSRSIGDLRELDAVLSSSMINFTAKIHSLTCMIEERRGTKEERLYLLHEIAEEAARLKYGGDDKIRVACTAADTLKAHAVHLHTLAERMPEFDVALLKRRTVYPHVSDKSFMPLNMDTGRRRRGGASGLLSNANAVDPSPAKRKRLPRDEEVDIGGTRSPHKRERPLADATNPRSRLGRGKKNERVPSPSESLVSVTSHLPSQNPHHPNGISSARGGASSTHTSALANSSTSGRNANGITTGSKRRGGAAAANNSSSNNNRVSTPLSTNDYPSHNPNSSSISASHRGANGLTSSHHPSNSSNLAGYANGTGGTSAASNGAGASANGNAGHYYNGTGGDRTNSVSGTPDLNIPSNQLLAGPGVVPFARSASVHSNVTNANGAPGGGGRNANGANGGAADGGTGEAGDADGDNDDNRTYCYCDGVSYGEMIACDDENCEREWFHLSCIGLTVCPEGSWFCDTCKNKRNTKRTGRGGKRRAAGNRTGGKA